LIYWRSHVSISPLDTLYGLFQLSCSDSGLVAV
jgi:hypothetical protein